MIPPAIPADTTPEAAWIQCAIFRRMSPARRLALALRMSDGLRATVTAGVRSRHPEYTGEQVSLAVLRLALGDTLFRQVFPGVEVAG